MTTNDDLRDDVKAIEDSIGGTDGINVRLARLEMQLRSHQESSAARDAATQAMLTGLAKLIEDLKGQVSSSWRLSIDPVTARTIGLAIGVGLASALGLGGLASGVLGAAGQGPVVSAPVALPAGGP